MTNAAIETTPAVAAPAPDAAWLPPVRYSEDDIPFRVAVAAHSGTSMTPEKRAQGERTGYVEHMRAIINQVAELTGPTEGERAVATAELERYRTGYLRHYLRLLDASSRTLSAMITGPSGFPTARNQKALTTEHKRRTEFLEWERKARASMLRAVRPPEQRAVSSDDPNAPEVLDRKVEELEEAGHRMKAANRIVKSKDTDEVKLRRLVDEVGLVEEKARELLVPDYMGRRGFPAYALDLNRKEVARLRARAEQIRQARTESSRQWTVGDVRVVDHVEENRIRLHYPSKPPEATRTLLRGAGFIYAPSVGAWQRKRTTAALWAAARVLGVTLDPSAASPVDPAE